MKEQFLDDVQKVYDYITNKKNDLNQLYIYLENNQFDKLTIIDDFAKHLGLELDDDLRVALVTRLVSLRDDSFVQILKKKELKEKQIQQYQEKAYIFVRDYWTAYHNDTLDFIDKNQLLTPFYRVVFEGVYKVGQKMSIWQSEWTKRIINGINKELLKIHKTDEAVMEYLDKNNLFDRGHDGEIADRSYSMLVKVDGKYESQSYIKAFKKEVTAVIDELEGFSDVILELEDDVYNQKWEYYKYLQALIKAFGETRTERLVDYWADVDRAWMEITSPIQIGHPLEYYEDHYRKAVALEWDIRLSNPRYQKANIRDGKLEMMADKIFVTLEQNEKNKQTHNFAKKSLKKVQLYLGRPSLFFGAEFNGLFSAQVVPNDEKVSAEFGKKIFAFSDEILQSSRAKPFYEITKEFFPKEFLDKERKFLFNEDKKWHQVYDITTIGHEFGHILWCDEETETIMNKTGNFKNIEEFKATTGGLVSFFMDESGDEIELEHQVIADTIKRAVGLIAWMEVDEVQPYYCEGLIHLNGLFSTRMISFDGKTLQIDMSEEKIKAIKQWYIDTYRSLANHYLQKSDATLWLHQFAKKDGTYFKPIDKNIKEFTQYYFERYKVMGTKLDTTSKKEDYIL
jgi:hypothetical protein